MILGISGKAGSGKDTIANIIKELHSGTVILHFGDALKDIVSRAFNIVRETLDSQEGKKEIYPYLGITNREILQRVGTLFRENFFENIWINNVMNQIDNPNGIYIIPDVRYPEELKAIQSIGGVIIRVERPGINKMTHHSETALDNYPFEYIVNNDRTINDLSNKIKDLWKKLH